VWNIGECVSAAQAAAESGSARPIVLCDCADNPGAGARGNTTFVLKALLEAKVPRVFAGVFNDAALVEAAVAVGVGSSFAAQLNMEEPDQFSELLSAGETRHHPFLHLPSHQTRFVKTGSGQTGQELSTRKRGVYRTEAKVVRISDGEFEGRMGMVAGERVRLGKSVVSQPHIIVSDCSDSCS